VGVQFFFINLDINVKIKDFQTDTITNPNTFDKNLQTEVSVADGQVLALGGFVKTKVTESTFKTPLLGNIPVLGWLFKNKKRQVTKEYVFIFMAPTIVKPRTAPGTNLYTKLKLHQAQSDIEEAIDVRMSKDPIHNWFFNPGVSRDKGETYSHKILDYSNARYQPTSVDILNDPYYRVQPLIEEERKEREKVEAEKKTEPPPEVPPSGQMLKIRKAPATLIPEEQPTPLLPLEPPPPQEPEAPEEPTLPEVPQGPEATELPDLPKEPPLPEEPQVPSEPEILIPEEEIEEKLEGPQAPEALRQVRREKLRQLLSAKHTKPTQKTSSYLPKNKQQRRKQMRTFLQRNKRGAHYD